MSTTGQRADLLELTPQALTALSNPGFVKRAQREIAEGKLPRIELGTDGAVSARYSDGQRATLAPGRALRDAQCTCPASGMCRHRVTLVLAYQAWVLGSSAPAGEAAEASAGPPETAWSPAAFDDVSLAAALAPATLEAAVKLAAARPVITVVAWQSSAPVPSARLPMCNVRFFSRASLAHARCDCKQGSACEHVALAVWAFRQAQLARPEFVTATIELEPPASGKQEGRERHFVSPDASPSSYLDALLLQLWLDGSSQPPVALEARFEAVRSRYAASGWNWVVESIDEVRRLLSAQNARSSGFDPARLLDALAELPARLVAARHAEESAIAQSPAPIPAAQILGLGIRGQVALDHLRLISLGVECWQGEEAEGVRIAFADPDSQSVSALLRSWPVASNSADVALMSRRVAGHALSNLACGQVVTKGARRRANGLVEIAIGVRQTSVLPLSPRAWDTLDLPLRQPSGRVLAMHLRDASPDFVRPKQAIEHLHVLPIARVLEWGWEASTQTLQARVVCAEDGGEGYDEADVVHLFLPHRSVAPGAVDAMARVLSGEWGAPNAVAGTARLEAGRLHLRPLTLLTETRAVVLEAEPAGAQSLPLGEVDTPSTPLAELVDGTRDMLVMWLRQGLRHQGNQALARANAQADRLVQAGLVRAGQALAAIIDVVRAEDRKSLPGRLAFLVLLLNGIRHGEQAQHQHEPA